jgi:hypothetical protein
MNEEEKRGTGSKKMDYQLAIAKKGNPHCLVRPIRELAFPSFLSPFLISPLCSYSTPFVCVRAFPPSIRNTILVWNINEQKGGGIRLPRGCPIPGKCGGRGERLIHPHSAANITRHYTGTNPAEQWK